MSRRVAAATLALLLPAVLGLSSCGDDEPRTSQPTTKQSEPDKPEPDNAVVVDIVVADGEVTPAGKQVEVRVGQRVELRVDSDVADELHVHSAPAEKLFEISAGDDQRFQLVPQQPGQFDVEVHSSGTLVAQLVVRP